tara:strand:- start:939 stop:1109 length:171 start_codon:yes stop_codon:yes gene_type:complete
MPNSTQNHLEAFLFRVIRNSLIDHFRKENIRNSYAESLEKKYLLLMVVHYLKWKSA